MLLLFKYIKQIQLPTESDFLHNHFIQKIFEDKEFKHLLSGSCFIEENEIKYMSGYFKAYDLWYIVTKDNLCWISNNTELYNKYLEHFKPCLFENKKEKKLIEHMDITL